MSNILGLLDLIDETVVVVEDEVLLERFCECHEEYYTQKELVSALKAQVSALQDGAVGTTLQMCQCEAHQTILDVTSPIREYVAKLLDIAASPPAVENQLSELIICILQILIKQPTSKFVLEPNFFYQKLGKKSSHCGSFVVHNTLQKQYITT